MNNRKRKKILYGSRVKKATCVYVAISDTHISEYIDYAKRLANAKTLSPEELIKLRFDKFVSTDTPAHMHLSACLCLIK